MVRRARERSGCLFRMASTVRAAQRRAEMNTIPLRTLVAAGIVLLVFSVINFWFWPDSSLQRSTTSFGTAANGYKAAFDLADELGFRPARSYVLHYQYND